MRRRFRRSRPLKKINLSPKFIYAALVVVCGVLIFCSFRFKDKFAPVRDAVAGVVTPMQRGIGNVGDAIANKLKVFSDMQELIEENDKLQAQVDELKAENSLLNQAKYEFSWYLDLYDLDTKYDMYDKVAAKVISRDPSSYCNAFIIDKGYEDGIEKDMNVISGNGLVGIITDVGKNWAKVRSLIDDASKVSGMFLKTSDTCIVEGNLEMYEDGVIKVSKIALDSEIYDNYEIVTSYISNKYLPGILIGYVKNITVDESTMAKQAYLTPAVDFQHIEAVLVIKELRKQYDDLKEVMSSDN